jgi:hypothetical protein
MTLQTKTQPAPWFSQLIAECLATLYLLNLEGCPAADSVGKTARIWERMLWEKSYNGWDEGKDDPRIRAAFKSIAHRCKRWPNPAVFWEHLPNRPAVASASGSTLDPDWGRERERDVFACMDRWCASLGIDRMGNPLNPIEGSP